MNELVVTIILFWGFAVVGYLFFVRPDIIDKWNEGSLASIHYTDTPEKKQKRIRIYRRWGLGLLIVAALALYSIVGDLRW